MRILVVDDAKKHRESALEQFGNEHKINAVDSYETAIAVLSSSEHGIDILLTDLLMPAEPYCLGKEGLKFLGHEIPIGFILMLRAAQIGVPQIVVLTDMNHHCHPMSAAVDWIAPAYWSSERNNIMQINQSRVLIAHAPLLDDGRKDWQAALCILQHSTTGKGLENE